MHNLAIDSVAPHEERSGQFIFIQLLDLFKSLSLEDGTESVVRTTEFPIFAYGDGAFEKCCS